MAFGRPISLTKNIANRTITVFATAGQSLFTVEEVIGLTSLKYMLMV